MNQKVIAFNKAQRQEREKASSPNALPELRAGDVVKVYRKIKEGAKTRTQLFQGMIIAINGGQSSSPTITIRKVSSGVGVELILPVNSPQIEKIEFVKRTRARRSKLYFVRDKSVKVLSKKLKEIALSASAQSGLEKKAQSSVENEEDQPDEIQNENEAPTPVGLAEGEMSQEKTA